MKKTLCTISTSPEEPLPEEHISDKGAAILSDLVLVCSMNFEDDDNVSTKMVFFTADDEDVVPDSHVFQLWVQMASILGKSETLNDEAKAICRATHKAVESIMMEKKPEVIDDELG